MSDAGHDESGNALTDFLGDLAHFFSENKSVILMIIFVVVLYFIDQELMLQVIAFYILLRVAFKLWMHYIQQDFITGIDYVLLEVIPPRDVLRSPRAMELFFTNALYHFSNKGGLEWFWQGAVWFWYSLEIVSIEGQVHFYIRTPTRLKDLIETQIYAQYPQAQIKVAEDYTLAVDEITPESAWRGWGCEFKLAKHHAYPIKTYVDYGLDKDPKEEQKIDPLSPVIELFSSLGTGEQYWLQFVIRPSKVEFEEHGHGHPMEPIWPGETGHDWVKEAELELERMTEVWTKKEVLPDGRILKSGRPPDSMKNQIDGINRKISKIAFDTGIRAFYVAKKENWSMNHRRDIRLIFRQYANPQLNSLERTNSTQADAFGGSFLSSFFLLSPKKTMILVNRMLLEYRERAFFHHPLRNQLLHNIPWPISPMLFPAYMHSHTYVLNVEELATLWHFPGQILKVPTLERVESKEASPPTNLPT